MIGGVNIEGLVNNIRAINRWFYRHPHYYSGIHKILVNQITYSKIYEWLDKEHVIYGVYPPAYARSSVNRGFQDLQIDGTKIEVFKYEAEGKFNYFYVPIDEVNLMITLDNLKLHDPDSCQRSWRIQAGYRAIVLTVDK